MTSRFCSPARASGSVRYYSRQRTVRGVLRSFRLEATQPRLQFADSDSVPQPSGILTGLDHPLYGGFSMADGEEHWLTYAEVADLFGISAEAARAMARRQKWSRRTPNEHGALARVLLPADRPIIRHRPAVDRGTNGGHPGYDRGATGLHPAGVDRAGDQADDSQGILRALEILVTPLREQLVLSNQRADKAEQRADEERARADNERNRADQAERRVAELLANQQPATATRRRSWWHWGRQ